MPHHLFDASNLLRHSDSTNQRQFLEKCFAQSVEETSSNQPLLLIVLVSLAIISTTAHRHAPHISRSLQAAGTHTAQELLWLNSR
ncbi:hypothetical protein [Chroogloeocystis siderophila]|uniref:Uncharacterized protein n=1 Tax=Chroogloeocystis siderophila 5.2 s.c.1 TaxID=247279 RepID=A0A1U7HU94_9CHRO|nr:hypothetical protein [Chroogloeocystis siderophila]OKH27104.1 hypothetical protein NIES1031_10335 [Chroogloeocystis siderophila 5.2 s.c.1]